MDEQTPRLWTRAYYNREKIYRLIKNGEKYMVVPVNNRGKSYPAHEWNRQWSITGATANGSPDPLYPYTVAGGNYVYT